MYFVYCCVDIIESYCMSTHNLQAFVIAIGDVTKILEWYD